MMKNRSFAFHAFFLLSPIFILTGIYGIGIFFGAIFDPSNHIGDPASVSSAQPEISDEAKIEELFLEPHLFSDEDVASGIAAYASSLPGISSRIGASVSVVSDLASVVPGTDPALIADANSVSRCTPDSEAILAPLPTVQDPSQADIWRIDTIYASQKNPNLAQLRKFIFYQWNGKVWKRRDDDAFFGTQAPAQPVVFYVHGNRTELNTAVLQGSAILRHFETEYPARLVIWRWDASRVAHRPRIEFSTKAHFADYQGFYLAKILDSLRPNSRVLLSAHSFGARTVLNALHLRAGGSFGGKFLSDAFPGSSYVQEISWNNDPPAAQTNGKTAPDAGSEAKPMLSVTPLEINALLVAPAVGCTAMSPEGLFPKALESVSALRMTQNTSDPALKFYPLMNGPARRLPEALGYVGPSWSGTDQELQSKVSVIRLDYPTHQLIEYMTMRSVQNALHF